MHEATVQGTKNSIEFVCDCYEADGQDVPRRDYIVTGHDNRDVICRYCDDCAELAAADWNGETKAIRPLTGDVIPPDPSLAFGVRPPGLDAGLPGVGRAHA